MRRLELHQKHFFFVNCMLTAIVDGVLQEPTYVKKDIGDIQGVPITFLWMVMWNGCVQPRLACGQGQLMIEICYEVKSYSK